MLQKHQAVCAQPIRRSPSKSVSSVLAANAAYQHLKEVVAYYELKVQGGGASSAVAVLRVISKEVDRDGLHGGEDQNEEEAPYVHKDHAPFRFITTDVLDRRHADDLGEIGFIRFACADGLELMPGPD